MKIFLTISAVLVLAAGLALGFMEFIALPIISFLAFALLLFAANLDRISEITASATGIRAKTRAVVERAEHAVTELQLLARMLSRLGLGLAVRTGRWGPTFRDDELDRVRDELLDVLKRLRVSEADREAVLEDLYRYTEFDYYHAILGGSYVPEVADKPAQEAWRALRDRGIQDVPSPTELRTFLVEHRMMTEEFDGYLDDYEYYRQHHAHRRPDVWKARQSWGRLKQRAA